MDIDEHSKNLLNKHLNYVLEVNKKHNLTTINNYKEAQIFHIEDSLSAIDIIKKEKDGKIVDLGSGAGFPGIPLAIMSGREVDLIESVGKKADCLKTFILKLGLESNVSVINSRIEKVAENNNKYQIATARALSSITSLLELASPLLKINGILICYKSFDINKELEQAFTVQNKLGMKYIKSSEYILSNGIKRKLIIFKKKDEATIKLPRKMGFAQKKPLK